MSIEFRLSARKILSLFYSLWVFGVLLGSASPAQAQDVTVSASGAQTATIVIPSTNQYVGGKFVIIDNTGSRNITGITITESGAVDALNNLDNIKLFYELDTTAPYDGASESFAGSELQFGATDTDGFSAANGTSSFTDSVAIDTTSTLVVYVVFDVGAGASAGETVQITIEDASSEVVASVGTVGPGTAVSISGTSILSAAGCGPVVNYRSIGAQATPLANTGTASVALNGTVVNFSGVSLPANLGQGDRIFLNTGGVNEERFILSRDSATRVTLQTPAQNSHGGVPYLIERVYNGATPIRDWEVATQVNLVGLNRRETGVAYNDAVFNDPGVISINGATTDACHFRTLTVAAGQRHTGIEGTGVAIDGGGGLAFDDDYTVLEWFEIANVGDALEIIGANLLFANLIIRDFGPSGFDTSGSSWSYTARNCFVYGGGSHGFSGGTGAGPTATVENCTIYGNSGAGINEGTGPVFTVRNTLSMGNSGLDFNIVAGTQTNNMSSDTSALPIANRSKLPADQFIDHLGTPPNFHLKSTADAKDIGSDLSAFFTNDIDNDPRPIGAGWEIGADEQGVAGPTLILADHDAGQVADKFTSTPSVTDVLFAFKLTRSGTVTVDNIRVNFTTGDVANGDVSNGELYRDVNNNGIFDSGTDTLVLGGVTPVAGVLAFNSLSEDPGAGTNYIVRATVINLIPNDTTTFSMGTADIDEVQGGITESGSITGAVHTQDGIPNLTEGHYRWRNDDGGESGGSDTTEVSSTGPATTTGTGSYEALTGMSITPGAGDYLVWFSGTLRNDTTGTQHVSLFLDGGQITHTEREITTESSIPDARFVTATHTYIAGVTAGQAINVQWQTSAGVATMLEHTLTVTKVNAADVTQVIRTNALSTGPVTDTLIDGMTLTPGAGDYLIWFSGSNANTLDPTKNHVSLYVNGTQVVGTEREIDQEESLGNTFFPVASHARVLSVGAGQAIEARWRVDAGMATMNARTLTVYKINPADNFQAQSDTDDGPFSGGTYTQVNSMTLTPGVGDYLVWFSSSVVTSGQSGDTFHVSLFSGGSQVLESAREIWNEGSIDISPFQSYPVATHAYITGVGATDDIEVRWVRTSGTGNATMHERTLAVQKIVSGSGATFSIAQDTKLTGLAKSTIQRVRFGVSNEGTGTSGPVTYELQVAETATCSAGTYSTVPTAAGGHWQVFGSTFITDGEATSDISPGLTNDATTFVTGELKDTGNTTGSITLATDEFTEIEFSVQALAAATDGGDYCFRLYDAANTQVLDTYTVYAEVQLAGAGGASLTLANHDSGQVADKFTTTSPVTDVLFRFKLTRSGTVTVDNLRVQYTTGTVIDADITSGELWRDVNNDGVVDGGDFSVQTGIAGSAGALAFNSLGEDPGIAGTHYLVRATVANLVAADTTTFSLGAADIDEVEGGVAESGSIANATHTQDVGSGSDIAGTISEDVNGDGSLADAAVRDNATVSLYQDGGDVQPDGGDDIFLTVTSTDVSGNYTFASLSAGTYWVVVDSKTVTPSAGLNGSFVQGDVWPEQTYGAIGAWCDDGTGVATELGATGACFGGQVSTVSDDASTLAASEHVTRVVVVASNVSGVDFGFSFVPVVNTLAGDAQDDDGSANRTVQGSLRQFIQNANAVVGANAMRFVPSGPTNTTDGGGNNWWSIDVTLVLPAVTDVNTTIDGTAYDRSDGFTVLNTNATLLGFVGAVGLGADALPGTADEPTLSGVQGPELEIVNDRATNVVDIGLDLQANDLTVRRIASYGFGSSNLFQDANIRVGINSGATNFTGILIEDNVIGSNAASFTDPGAGNRSTVNDIAVFGADSGTIQSNLIGYAGRFGVFLSDTAVGWTVQGNEIRANALTNAAQDGLDIGNSSSGATVSGNLFALSDGGGVDSWRGLGNNLIENNTFSQNGQAGTEPAAMRIFGADNVIRLNDIQDNVGPGVLIVSDISQTGSPSIQNDISQNRFSGNGSNAIDLLALGGDASLGDGITVNDASTDAQAGNIGLDYPVITSATISAGTTTVTGTTCASCDVEVYRAVAGAGDTLATVDYGEGVEFLGSTTADGLGDWTVGGITTLIAGDDVSAITMDTNDNTSEFGVNVTVVVAGSVSLTLADHGVGQVGDRFTTTASVTEVLYQFKLTRVGTFDVTELRVNFTTTDGIASGDVTSAELWRDLNGNGAVDGADTMIQGGITGSGGQLIFTTDFTPGTGAGTDYLVRATVNNLADGEFTTFSLSAAEITESVAVPESGSVSNALHIQDPAPPSCSASFNWLGTPLDVSPGGTGAWVDVDVSATVPAGSTGVILQVVGDAATDYDYGVRMNGSSDDWMIVDNDDNMRNGPIQRFYMVGVDAGRIFEVFQDSATITTYLVGYTGNGVTFFLNAINKSFDAPLNSYQPISIAADTGGDTAIGAIFNINNLFSSGTAYGLRHPSSGLDIYNETRAESFHTQVVGVDGSEVAEAKIGNAQLDIYLTGYITSGAVFFTTPLNKSTATLEPTYVDVDITGDIGADDANGVFLEFNEVGNASRNVAVRMNGETYDLGYYNEMRHHGAFTAIDGSDIFEQKIQWDDMDLYMHGYTLASCGAPAPTTNYRSIGSAGPYSAFDVAATNGSPVVVGNGTAWVTANRGRGDHIDIDGADYTILSVDTESQLTLTGPFTGVTGVGKAYTISRQFDTLQEWEDCISTGVGCVYFPVAGGDLVGDNRREVGIAYADTDFTWSVLGNRILFIDDSTTDADHDITLTADGGNRHYGRAGQGVVLDNTTNTIDAMGVRDDFVTVEWLEVKNGGAGTDGIQIRSQAVSNRVVVRNNLVHDVGQLGIVTNYEGLVIDIYNNIVYNTPDPGIRIGAAVALTAASEIRILNNTVYNIGNNGISTSGAVAAGSTEITLQNNIAHTTVGDAFLVGSPVVVNAASSNNLSSDGTALTHSPNSGSPNGIQEADVNNLNFVSTTPGSEDLHITSGSAAENLAADLSSTFDFDIDSGGRVLPWDIGADDIAATTAVELVSFEARGIDGAVELTWETGSEIDNLGFHLYRSLTEEGAYEQITASVIPGLGSSPEGAKYAYHDSGRTNGVTYYYRLEDIETTGVTELHGPVSATPTAEVIVEGDTGDEEDGTGEELGELSSRITYGDPAANELKVRRRGKKWMELELITEGFYAIPQEDGSVLLEVPGFEDFGGPDLPDVPAYRTWQNVLAGRNVKLASVKVGGVAEFASLRPSSSELIVVASGDGTVQTGRRRKKRRQAPHVYYPESWAQLMNVGFQGPAKKALVEMAPLRWDATAEKLVLARRIVVRIAFKGKDKAELKLGKSHREVGSHANRSVYARIAVTEPGLYGVSYESVFGKRRKAIKTSSLRLSRQGEPVAFFVSPNAKKFKKKSVLYFLSDGSDLNPYGQEAVYELEASQQGLRMEALNGAPEGAPTSFYWKTVKREENLLYQAAFEGEEDIWQWDWLFGPMTNGYPFEVTNLSPVAENSKLRVWLHGASDFPEDPDHHVRLYVNGTLLTDTWWDGETPHFVEAELGPGLLQEGENTLEIEEVGDTEAQYSMVMLDRFEVSYPSQLVAQLGELEGSFSESGVATVTGPRGQIGALSPPAVAQSTEGEPWGWGPKALIFDVTETEPRRISGASVVPGGLSFGVESGRHYLLTDSVKIPEVSRAQSTGLKQVWSRAEYLVIGPREFLAAAVPLLAHRRNEGLIAGAIATEDIYDEFGYGEATPESIRDFLSYVYHHWSEPTLRYVVLLGDGTYDYKDYLATGVKSQVPVKILKTRYIWTASDPWYGAINGDDILPDVAIGRLPAASIEEVQTLVQKILAYESASPDSEAPIVLVTDNPDIAGNFDADAEEIASTVFSEEGVEKIYLSQLGTAGAQSAILNAFDEGASLMSYMGHGAIHLWANENLLNIWQVESLSSQEQQPLLLTMNCLNGYFHFPYFNSLSEELLKAEGKGIIAAFSPTGLSLNNPAHRFHKALLDHVVNQQHERLGDAILAGQAAYAETGAFPELLRIYHLLGDPALRLR